MKAIYRIPQTEIIPVLIESQLCSVSGSDSDSIVGFTGGTGSGAGLAPKRVQ